MPSSHRSVDTSDSLTHSRTSDPALQTRSVCWAATRTLRHSRTAVASQVTHMVLVSPEQLDRICSRDSRSEGPSSDGATPFRRLIRDLLLFFEHTYRVSRIRTGHRCIRFVLQH